MQYVQARACSIQSLPILSDPITGIDSTKGGVHPSPLLIQSYRRLIMRLVQRLNAFSDSDVRINHK